MTANEQKGELPRTIRLFKDDLWLVFVLPLQSLAFHFWMPSARSMAWWEVFSSCWITAPVVLWLLCYRATLTKHGIRATSILFRRQAAYEDIEKRDLTHQSGKIHFLLDCAEAQGPG